MMIVARAVGGAAVDESRKCFCAIGSRQSDSFRSAHFQVSVTCVRCVYLQRVRRKPSV